jgi:hypothetical protein
LHPRQVRALVSRRAAFIPAGVMLVAFFVSQPFIQWTRSPWAGLLIVLLLLLPLQVLATWWALMRAQWPATAHALLAVGYEVCPACGFDLSPLPPEEPCCPECGATRLRPKTFLPGTGSAPPRPILTTQAGEPT